jgi:hypothetical protein
MANYFKEDDFKQWLEDDNDRWNDSTSVSSYKSGVGSMINWVNNNKGLWKTTGGTKVQDFEWYLQNIGSVADRDTFFSAVLNIIQIEINKNPKNKSTLQNYKSYLCAFEEFFRNETYPPLSISASQKKVLKNNSSCATYTQAELINEFKGRILTQDRISMSKPILFPIRLISKLWPVDSDIWAEGVCKNIYIIVQDTKSSNNIFEKRIKDIETLKIEKTGEVKVKIKNDNNDYIMCTSYSDPHEYTKIEIENDKIKYKYISKRKEIKVKECDIPQDGYIIDKNKNIRDSKKKIILWHVKPVKIKRLGDIAIDHDIPISLVLKEKERKLSTLLTMSDVYRTLSYKYELKVSANEVNNFCKKIDEDGRNRLLNAVNLKLLAEDLKLIGKYKLVLMSKDENSQKSDS